MKETKIRQMMVPFSEHPTILDESSLYEAVQALDEAKRQWDKELPYAHRTVLVMNSEGQVVGKLGPMDVVVGLEDGYKKIGDMKSVSHSGFTSEFIQLMMQHHHLWQKPLQDLCKKAAKIKVGEIMSALTEGEYIEEDASLDKAVHQLIVGKHRSLLVTQEGKVIGVLRLEDIFYRVCEQIKACGL